MKKLAPLLFFTVFIAVPAQQIRDNPKTPLNKNAGRVLKLIEVMRIAGEGENYYHNGANKLQIDQSGNIYLCDSWTSSRRSHLLKFSSHGGFLKDFYRQGEGPGEIQSMYDFSLNDSEIFIYDFMKRKIIVMDLEGNFKREFKNKFGSFFEPIGIFKDWLVFSRRDRPYELKKSRLYDVKNVVVFISKDGLIEKDFFTFTNKSFFISPSQGGGFMSWDPFISVIGDDRLYVCRSQEYLIEVLDLEKGKIVSRFKRKYPRIKHERRDWEKEFISKYNAPKKKFEPDIEGLLYSRGHLWVKTSTANEENGMLYDIYDMDGGFLDSFFINIKGRIVKIEGNFLYSSEADEDLLPCVVKYRIADLIGTR